MIRSLAMIAVAGFVVSVLSIAGAAALGGYDANKHGWTFPVQWDWDDNNDSHDSASRIDWNSPLTINELKRADLELNVHAASRVAGKIDVDRLDLNVHSAGEATLSGRADDLELDIHSAGKARLAQLAVKTAHGEANSAGDADIAP